MASIVLRTYGGMAPSANKKAISESTASFAQNLDLRFGDFRPLPQPAFVGAATPGATLYKFETGGTFLTRPGQVNFVRGPIPTDATERTYYTGDGVPKATDLSGAVRQLGVPAPLAAPAATVNAVAQFSTDDAQSAKAGKLSELLQVVMAQTTTPYVGLSDADLAGRFVPGPAAWSFWFVINGTMVSGAFVPTNPAHRNLMDDRLLFSLLPLPSGDTSGVVDLVVRGFELVFNAGLAAALAAITDPSDPAKKLLGAEQVSAITSELFTALHPADAQRDTAIAHLHTLKEEFVALADSGSAAAAALPGAVKDYYDQAHVVEAVDAAVDAAVSGIFSAMLTFN